MYSINNWTLPLPFGTLVSLERETDMDNQPKNWGVAFETVNGATSMSFGDRYAATREGAAIEASEMNLANYHRNRGRPERGFLLRYFPVPLPMVLS